MNNIDHYIQRAVKRELAAQGRVERQGKVAVRKDSKRRSDASRRHIDKCALAVRHSDGLQDIATKIKEKAAALMDMLKNSPKAQKVVRGLGILLSLISATFAVKSAVDVKRQIQQINACNKEIQSNFDEFSSLEDYEEGGAPLISKKKAFIKGGLKALLGLVSAFCGILMQKYAKNSEEV